MDFAHAERSETAQERVSVRALSIRPTPKSKRSHASATRGGNNAVEKRWQVIHSGLLSVECVAPVDDARKLREAQACTP